MSLHQQLHPAGMTTTSWVLLIAAAVVAAVDWCAVGLRRHGLEYASKPVAIALLAAVAVALTPVDGLRRGYVVSALLFSLAGDVFLMLPGADEGLLDAASTRSDGRAGAVARERPAHWPAWFDPFVFGLAAFLLAHLNYIGAFRVGGPGAGPVLVALVGVAAVAVPLGTLISRSLTARGMHALRVPVVVYIAALSGMAATAVATGNLLAAGGATAFVLSDAALAWNRFVRPVRGARVIVAVSYHVAQALLAVSLVR